MDKLSLLFVEAIRESGGQDAIVPGAFATVAMRNGILKNRARPKEEAPAKLGAAESHRVLSDLWGATEAQLDEEPELAEHLTPDLPVLRHTLEWLRDHEGYVPDVVAHLRATCPLRSRFDVDRGVAMLLGRPSADSVRSVVKVPGPEPWRMWTAVDAGAFAPLDMAPLATPPGLPVPARELAPPLGLPAPAPIVRGLCLLTCSRRGDTGSRFADFKIFDRAAPRREANFRSVSVAFS